MQEKTPELHHTSVPVALKLNKQKTKILTINVGNDEPVTLEGEKLEKVESFAYLGSVVDKQWRTNDVVDVKTRIGKERPASYMLKKVWNSRVIGTSTKVHLLNANGKPTMVYTRETRWPHG